MMATRTFLSRLAGGIVLAIAVSTSALAAGDFALASCKGWNGTVVERNGINTRSASMRGIITKADIQEYCERDPGGETRQYGGKLTVAQCVAKYMREEGKAKLYAEANCSAGTIS